MYPPAPPPLLLGLISGIMSYSVGGAVYQNTNEFKEYELSIGEKIPDSYQGEGTKLGGVYVFGKGDEGMLFCHKEMSWGHKVDLTDVANAVKSIGAVGKSESFSVGGTEAKL